MELQSWETGGGCRALASKLGDMYVLVTDNGGLHEPEIGQPYMVGFFDDESGEQLKSFEFGEFNLQATVSFIQQTIGDFKVRIT